VARTLLVLFCFTVAACGCKKKPPPAGSDTPAGKTDGTPSPLPNTPILPTRPSLPSGWVEFRQPEGAFSVYLPGHPQPMRVSAGSNLSQPVPQGRALMAEYKLQLTGMYVQLGASVYSPELTDGVRAAHERRPLKPGETRTQVTWAGHPAVEKVTEDPESHNVTVERQVWVGNRAYYLQLWGQQPGRPTAEERKTVFDSYTLRN
jgi:hypothetical protein